MFFIIAVIVLIILLVPFVYELANFVYAMEHKRRFFKTMRPWLFFFLLTLIQAALVGSSVFLLWHYGELEWSNLRMYCGAELGIVLLIYSLRLIPVYYDDRVKVQSHERLTATFVKEILLILAAFGAVWLFTDNFWVLALVALIAATVLGFRIEKFVRLKKADRRPRRKDEIDD